MHRHEIGKNQEYVEKENEQYKGNNERIPSKNVAIWSFGNFQERIDHDYCALSRCWGPYWKFTMDIYHRYVLYIVIGIFPLRDPMKVLEYLSVLYTYTSSIVYPGNAGHLC